MSAVPLNRPSKIQRLFSSRRVRFAVAIALVIISFVVGLAFPRFSTTTAFGRQLPVTFSTRTAEGYNFTLWNFTINLSGRDPGSTSINFTLSYNFTRTHHFAVLCLTESDKFPNPWNLQTLAPSCLVGPTNALVGGLWSPPTSGKYAFAFNDTLTRNEIQITGIETWTVTRSHFL